MGKRVYTAATPSRKALNPAPPQSAVNTADGDTDSKRQLPIVAPGPLPVIDALAQLGEDLHRLAEDINSREYHRTPTVAQYRAALAASKPLRSQWRAVDRFATVDEVQVAVITKLLAAYPNAKNTEMDLYSKVLVDDIAATRPTVFELGRACRALRRQHKFVPTVSEVLDCIKKVKRQTYWYRDTLAMLTAAGLKELEDDAAAYEKRRLQEEEAAAEVEAEQERLLMQARDELWPDWRKHAAGEGGDE